MAKTLQKFTVLCVKFVVSRQWTVVQFVVSRQWTVVVCGEQTVDCSTVCGEQTVDCSTVSRWATHFCEGRVTINDDPRPGRPKTSTDEQSVKLVVDFLAQDRQAMCKEISQATRISPTSVFHILTNDLQKRKICAQWVAHCLTAEQEQKCLEIATLLKQRFNVGQAPLY